MGSINPDSEAKQELDDSGYVQEGMLITEILLISLHPTLILKKIVLSCKAKYLVFLLYCSCIVRVFYEINFKFLGLNTFSLIFLSCHAPFFNYINKGARSRFKIHK